MIDKNAIGEPVNDLHELVDHVIKDGDIYTRCRGGMRRKTGRDMRLLPLKSLLKMIKTRSAFYPASGRLS